MLLMRHAHPDTDGIRRCIGQTDLPLSEEGRTAALRTALSLRDRGITALYSSDLTRAAQTAQIVGEVLHLPVHSDRSLREIDMGEWDGLSFSQIRSQFPAEYEARGKDLFYYRTPNGESFADAGKRMYRALQSIASDGGNPLVVTHRGAIRGLFCLCGLLSEPQALALQINYCDILSFCFPDEKSPALC